MADHEDRPADDERDGTAVGDGDAETPDDSPTKDDRGEPSDEDSTSAVGDRDRDDEPAGENSDAEDSAEDEDPDREEPDRDEDEPDTDTDTDSDETDAEHDDDEDEDVEDDNAEHDDNAEPDGEAEPEPASALPPPVEPAPFVELMAAYRQPATAGAERLPWSWATLSPAETEATAVLLDGFVESYNRTWAIGDDQTVPPCWHRHPALAHDLAALAWSYFQAYRDPTATPDRAIGFQTHLPLFAERVDRWLGANATDCRAGRHTDAWTDRDRVNGSRGTSTEDADAVILLGRETFGFTPTPTDR